MATFRTHTGEVVEGECLAAALKQVSDDWRRLGFDIRNEDAYADHVTEAEKDAALLTMLDEADAVASGRVQSFTIWQRVNAVLTGECVALLPDQSQGRRRERHRALQLRRKHRGEPRKGGPHARP